MRVKRLILTTLAFSLLSGSLFSIDYDATLQSAWADVVERPPSGEITEAALRDTIEWQVFNGPIPKVNSATHYGLRLKWWNRIIKRFGIAIVAKDYSNFLIELKAALAKDQQQPGQSVQ
ncbi:MAG TPA: hypothetical protein VNQ90_02890 [Chthoniobacteraceae bacterium]|nr:hypothetical protein [Chthoniobacteraceae bacterium]